MAVAYDTATEDVQAADPQNFNHTPVGTPKGVIVFIAHGAISTDIVAGVTYGGVAMTRVGTASASTLEPGRSYAYKLESGVPTGTQTVSIDRTDSTTPVWAIAITVTAGANTEVITSDVQGTDIGGNSSSPSSTLSYGGRTALGLVSIYSSSNAPTNLTDMGSQTRILDHDFGANVAIASRQTTVGSTGPTLGWTSGGNVQYALVALAISEVVGGTTYPQSVAVTSTFTVSLVRSISVTKAITSTLVAGLLRRIGINRNVSSTLSVSLVKRVGIVRNISSPFSVEFFKSFVKLISISSAFTVRFVKKIGINRSNSSSFVVNLVRFISLTKNISSSFVVGLSRIIRINRNISSTFTVVFSKTKVLIKQFAISSPFIVGFSKLLQKNINISSTFTVNLARFVSIKFAIVSTYTVTLIETLVTQVSVNVNSLFIATVGAVMTHINNLAGTIRKKFKGRGER